MALSNSLICSLPIILYCDFGFYITINRGINWKKKLNDTIGYVTYYDVKIINFINFCSQW